jgi:acyl-CoA reductase-like NAD-dependent aldehyde dehydrogenase
LIKRVLDIGATSILIPFVENEGEAERAVKACLYTTDLGRAMRVTDQLEYGMVAVNTPKFTGASIPFGGWKQSGLGREGSRHGITEYLEPKYVCFGNLAA